MRAAELSGFQPVQFFDFRRPAIHSGLEVPFKGSGFSGDLRQRQTLLAGPQLLFRVLPLGDVLDYGNYVLHFSGAVANFVYVEIGEDTPQFFERLLEEGVIVRPLGGFGASTAIRISVGTPDELEFLDAALGRIRP